MGQSALCLAGLGHGEAMSHPTAPVVATGPNPALLPRFAERPRADAGTPERALDQLGPDLVIVRRFDPRENMTETLRPVFAPWLDCAEMARLRSGYASRTRGKVNSRGSRNHHPRIDRVTFEEKRCVVESLGGKPRTVVTIT